MKIALYFYTTVFPFVCRPLYDKKTFYHFCTCSVAYEKLKKLNSIKEIHPLYLTSASDSFMSIALEVDWNIF